MEASVRDREQLGRGLGRSSRSSNGQPSSPVIEEFSSLSPQEFGQKVGQYWQACEKIAQSVIEVVEQGQLAPLTGLGIISCVTGQAFAYTAFHGDSPPAEMFAQLAQLAQQGSR